MKISNECFLILNEFGFYTTIKVIECDKKDILLKTISKNFKNFKLKNLVKIMFVEIWGNLKILFSLNNICSSLKELDLSDTYFSDDDMLELKTNIFEMKKIEIINIKNTNIGDKSVKWLDYFKNLKIKILIDQILTKKLFKIILAGSTISGKTCYYRSCLGLDYSNDIFSNNSFSLKTLNPSFNKNIEIQLLDTPRWGEPYLILNRIPCSKADGIILLFDVSRRNDFDGLIYILNFIKELCIENIPILLIGNKIDLYEKMDISEEEIRNFQHRNNLIDYFEVSCKNGINVKESFDFLAKYLFEKSKVIISNNN